MKEKKVAVKGKRCFQSKFLKATNKNPCYLHSSIVTVLSLPFFGTADIAILDQNHE